MSHQYAVASASWPDHLVFGEEDGRLDTVDALEVVPQVAHSLGMKAQLYVSVLDDGRGLPTEEERRVSHDPGLVRCRLCEAPAPCHGKGERHPKA